MRSIRISRSKRSGTRTSPEDAAGPKERAHPGRLAVWWLRIVNKQPLAVHAVSSSLVFGLLLWATVSLGLRTNNESWLIQWLRELFVAVVSLAIPLLATVAALKRPLASVLRILAQATSGSGAPVLLFVGDTLQGMEDDLAKLRGEGAVLEVYAVAAWVRRCFKAATGQYVGTDSHLPSAYNEIYSDYLPAHLQYLKDTKRTNNRVIDSVRIMLVDIERLRTDQGSHPDAFDSFMGWHSSHPVALLHLPQRENEQLTANPAWGSTLQHADIGFWRGDFVLLFERISDEEEETRRNPSLQVRLRLAFKGEPIYDICEEYVDALLEKTEFGTARQRDVGDELPIYSHELSRNWQMFSDPEVRIKKTGPLLEGILSRFKAAPPDLRVLDAAAGIGIESTYLLERGYFLIANEIEPALRRTAADYAQSRGTNIPDDLFTRTNWLSMSDRLPRSSFHAVYVLGNSLCHLEDLEQVQRAVENFYELLIPGGVLICDERNFSYILGQWDSIQKDAWNEFRFNKRDEGVMYYGKGVMGAPVDRRRRRVIFEYAKVTRDSHDRLTAIEKVGELSMLAFGRGVLKGCLMRAGFATIDVYCDLIRSEDGVLKDEADFFTYAAVKNGHTAAYNAQV